MVLACYSTLTSGPGLASNLAGREPGLRAANSAAHPVACLSPEHAMLGDEHFEAFEREAITFERLHSEHLYVSVAGVEKAYLLHSLHTV